MKTALVIGNPTEPMIEAVHDGLRRRGGAVELLANHDLPGTVGFGFDAVGGGFFALPDGRRLDLADVRSVYQRVGFFESETFADYTPEESRYASAECLAAMTAMLDVLPALVVNRPQYAGSNASKPYQVGLVEAYGFLAPRTLVTNRPEDALAFYEACEGNVIYKSISYVRSIVKRMTEDDLARLDTLATCPVQLQECVEGRDVRVHVVGPQLFPSLIEAEQSDYRYDRDAEITACELPDDIRDQCFATARGLGFVLTGIDLRVTDDGRWYCFEVNPSPAFTWYEARTGQPITDALCDVLENPHAVDPWP